MSPTFVAVLLRHTEQVWGRAPRGSKVTPYLIDNVAGRVANRRGAAASPSDFGTGGMSWQTFSSSEENKKEVMGAPLSFSSRADPLLFNSLKETVKRSRETASPEKISWTLLP